MKLNRALLISSKNQAKYWEKMETVGPNWFLPYTYCFLATLVNESIRFQVFCVSQESYRDDRKQERTRNKVADLAHVEEIFEDEDELNVFLQKYQISEDGWQPVEEAT